MEWREFNVFPLQGSEVNAHDIWQLGLPKKKHLSEMEIIPPLTSPPIKSPALLCPHHNSLPREQQKSTERNPLRFPSKKGNENPPPPSSPATAMVDTRRSAAEGSGAGAGRGRGRGEDDGKRPLSSSPPSSPSPTKRPKTVVKKVNFAVAETSPRAADAEEPREGDAIASVRNARQPQPWAKLLSQFSEIPHLAVSVSNFSVGADITCNLCLGGGGCSKCLCILRRSEQGQCEIEVTGGQGRVEVNLLRIFKGTFSSLTGGDEVVFFPPSNHAYIFQYPLLYASAGENNCEVVQSMVSHASGVNITGDLEALEDQRDCNMNLNPSATLPPNEFQAIKDGLKQGILSPSAIEVTLENFPYYLSKNTRGALFSVANVRIIKKSVEDYLSKITCLNQRILLSGPSGSEIYQETLIKALAKEFDARLLIVDSLLLPDAPSKVATTRRPDSPTSSSESDVPVSAFLHKPFREGDQVEYIGPQLSLGKSRGPSKGYRGRVVLAFENNSNSFSKVGVRFDEKIPGGNDLGGLCDKDHGFFCAVAELCPISSVGQELMEVISEESKSSTLIVLLKDVEKIFTRSTESHVFLSKKLPPGVLIVGSHTQTDRQKDESCPKGLSLSSCGTRSQGLIDILGPLGSKLHERNKEKKDATNPVKHLNTLFPSKISIELPQDEAQLSELKQQLQHDTENLRAKANVLNICKFLAHCDIGCNNIEELLIRDRLLTDDDVNMIVGVALQYDLQFNELPKDAKPVLSIESLKHGLSKVQIMDSGSSKKTLKGVATENEFERKLLSDVISPNDTGVTFDDIGALETVKDKLKEMIMLPLQRPEFFSKGLLSKPLKGILLFGPPGTGKTMLAKAIATEAGVNFINISMASISSKWIGEGEKCVKAVFSLASKMSPAVIFIDEIDSLLGKRGGAREHESTRKLKNEFLTSWDGLLTKDQERVLVLGATNRPFDLDGAAIRRFSCRLMVNLPDVSNREKILKLILSKEELAADVDLKLLANMTDGYSGSDLKNLCETAARYPIREIIKKENEEMSLARTEGRPEPPKYGPKDIPPLRMEHLRFAHEQVCASVSSDSRCMSQLIQWNDKYGEGGSRKKEDLSYFT